MSTSSLLSTLAKPFRPTSRSSNNEQSFHYSVFYGTTRPFHPIDLPQVDLDTDRIEGMSNETMDNHSKEESKEEEAKEEEAKNNKQHDQEKSSRYHQMHDHGWLDLNKHTEMLPKKERKYPRQRITSNTIKRNHQDIIKCTIMDG
eukprot:CAMPEP_0194442452 /NCGR_PEP_ID=MMETSP0176-20130528/126138_1 /TAXON_ID=216777 /ORGANISM="Proboscia alata, Strain PI-D3" /LENGTH=144 /DNA_ID=CAMNT_0039268551 /DNA_START=70 /DNA_END=504 /DNA_ORIENTATION=-